MKPTPSAGERDPQPQQPRKFSRSRKARAGARPQRRKRVPPPKRQPPGEPAGTTQGDPEARGGPVIGVRVQSPPATLAVVPHLLGFVPESSVVVVGTGMPDGQVRVTLRYDLPERPDGGLAEDMAEHAVSVLAAQHLTAAIVIGYGPEHRVGPLATAFTGAARQAGIRLQDILRAEGGRYWSYTCTDERCCPAAGTAYDAEGHVAGFLQGRGGGPVLPSRGALAGSIAPLAGLAAEAMRQATGRAERHVTQIIAKVRKSGRVGAASHMIASEGLAAVADMVARYRRGERYESDYQLAWLCVALRDLRVRDDAWARMDPRHRVAHRRLWTDVVRRAQPGYAPAPASLLAFVAWQDGDGALANVALDRALADDPEYTMALLLRQVLAAGAPPAMARLPLTPEEVAECYRGDDGDDGAREDGEAGRTEGPVSTARPGGNSEGPGEREGASTGTGGDLRE